MSSSAGVSPIGSHPRELRVEEDRALLQPYELPAVYDLQEQQMIRPVSVGEDGRYGVRRMIPGIEQPRVSAPPPAAELSVTPRPHGMDEPPAVPVPRLAPPMSAGHTTRMIGTAENADGATVGAGAFDHRARPTKAEAEIGSGPPPLPYGADAVRIRQLLDAIIGTPLQVPLLFQFRQAGDLVAAPSDGEPAAPRVRRVEAADDVF